MNCFYPLRILRDSENNIVFTNDGLPSLPCGQCLGCRLSHAEGWAIRMVHEAQLHKENSFLTLTYNDENLPCNKNLSYRALTAFIKRLRKQLSKTPYRNAIKYYAVGEYGENFSRPHYHIILFGYNFSYGIRYKGKENQLTPIGENLRRSTFLDDLWGQGFCSIGDVNYDSCMYVAKYVTKKVNGRNKDSFYQRILDDGEIVSVEPERAFMSRKEAIGKKWLQKFHSDVYPEDNVVHNARRYKTPKYYDRWLEKNDPELFSQIKQSRENSMIGLSSKTAADLTRIHEVKLLTHKQYSSNLEGTPTINEVDEKLLDYYKREQTTLHQQRKKHVKNVHGL